MNVGFFIFNRLKHTKESFSRIAEAKPEKLFIVADGARVDKEGEADLCESVRRYVISNVTWDCEVFTDFSEVNQGCKKRVSSGIDWIFSEVEEAIIIEDDCVPDLTFFDYCIELLEHYREDDSVMHIGGQNMIPELEVSEESYYFSKLPHIWGWATWRRAWEKYDLEIGSWKEWKDSNALAELFKKPAAQEYWKNIFDQVERGSIDTWDYQWMYCCLSHKAFCVVPKVNMIRNVGFGEGATHTHNEESEWANMTADSLDLPLSHPSSKAYAEEAFEQLLRQVFTPQISWKGRVKKKIKALLKLR